MDQTLDAILQKQLDTIQRIELFLDIYKCKEFVAADLNKLKEDSGEAAEKLSRTREYLETDRKDVCSQFIKIMQKMRRNELLMLHLWEVGPHSEAANAKPAQSDTPKSMPLKEVRMMLQVQDIRLYYFMRESWSVFQLQNDNPSKMHLTDYSKSPFATRSKSKDIHFYDFDAEITEEEFDTIPKYLRGRMQLSELIQFLEKDVIKCFEEKYTLMYKHRKAVSNQHDLTAWKDYNSMQAKFPGKSNVFICD